MRGKHNRRLLRLNRSHRSFNGNRRKCLVRRVVVGSVSGQYGSILGDIAFFNNLRPAITKLTITNDQNFLVSG